MLDGIHRDKLLIAPDRQRQEFDPEALTDLVNSIASRGLLHPIVVRETVAGPVLVAGERRLRALETIWALGDSVRHNGRTYREQMIPTVTLGELSLLDAEEAELDENLKRRDLSWQERASALSRLHKLRVAQAYAIGQTQTLPDTLRELADDSLNTANYATNRAAILIADHLHNPEVAKAKNVQEAFKAIQRQESRDRNIALAETVGQNFNSSVHKLIRGNCIDWLSTCPANTFDVILTDPPYGMNAQAFGDGGGKLVNSVHTYDDSPAAWNKLMEAFCPETFRVAKPQAHCYIFCDFDKFHILKAIMQSAGWYVFRTPLIVHKLGSGRVPLPDQGPRRQYELCLYAIKGNRPVTGIYSDVISCKLEENLSHGANKPVELFVDLLRRSCRPGDQVLDAFAGSGTIFPAAHQAKVYATGLEISPEYYGIAVARLNALDDELSMI